jgi:hypothetical protein
MHPHAGWFLFPRKLADFFLFAREGSRFVWLVAGGWCRFVLREKYCWLVAGGWFVLREKYCWLVADKPSEGAASSLALAPTAHSPIQLSILRKSYLSQFFTFKIYVHKFNA